MGLFRALTLWGFEKPTRKPSKKPIDDSITPFQKTFLDQFPIWSIKHSQKLAQELAGVSLSQEEKDILIDCLTGGHQHYLILSLSQEKEDYEVFGGNDKIIPAIVKSWPERASSFALEASEVIGREVEQALKSGKKGEPIAVYLSIETTKFIKNGSKQFSPSPLVLVALRDLFHRLDKELVDWLIELLDPGTTKSSKCQNA